MKIEKLSLAPEIRRDILSVSKKAQDLPKKIEDQDSYETVATAQKTVQDLVKNIKAWYKKHTAPIKAALDALRSEEKQVLAGPESWNEQARQLLADYFLRKEQIRLREEAKLQKQLEREAEAARRAEIAALKKEDKAAAAALARTDLVVPVAKVENVAALSDASFRKDVEVQILDLEAVPREYLRIEANISALKAAWKAGLSVPGVAFKEIRVLAR